MEFGLFHEFQKSHDTSEEDAFAQSFELVDAAEAWGLDAMWLAELHFAPDRSVLASPLILAAAIAQRTRRMKIGTAVQVLPLCHPLRLAEEAATVDQISDGRLIFGVGRSGFPRAYSGYGVRYDESRDRFQESLEVILKAWTERGFSHQGKYYTFENLTVVPQPYQKPHPPIWVAATTQDTFPLIGGMGLSLVTGLRGFDIPEARRHLAAYRAARRAAGHPGDGNVYVRMPVYVADTAEGGLREPEESTMRSYRRLAENMAQSVEALGTTAAEERAERAARLAQVTYDEVLRDRVAYGTPDMVVDRLRQLRDELGLSGVIAETNVGGRIPLERVLRSIHLYAEEVAPRLR